MWHQTKLVKGVAALFSPLHSPFSYDQVHICDVHSTVLVPAPKVRMLPFLCVAATTSIFLFEESMVRITNTQLSLSLF